MNTETILWIILGSVMFLFVYGFICRLWGLLDGFDEDAHRAKEKWDYFIKVHPYVSKRELPTNFRDIRMICPSCGFLDVEHMPWNEGCTFCGEEAVYLNSSKGRQLIVKYGYKRR